MNIVATIDDKVDLAHSNYSVQIKTTDQVQDIQSNIIFYQEEMTPSQCNINPTNHPNATHVSCFK